jgi:YD repeat-containing protein
VSCTGDANCLAGGTDSSSFDFAAAAAPFIGQTGNPGGITAHGALCVTEGTCVLVGSDSGAGAVETTTDAFSEATSDSVASGTAQLSSVACSPEGLCFAVGDTTSGAGTVLADTGDPLTAAYQAMAPSEAFANDQGEICVPCTLAKIKAGDSLFAVDNAGDPVNTSTGDLAESVTDADVVSYGPPLTFTRQYDSELAETQAGAGTPGPLGYGWAENWDASLTISGGDVTVNEGSGAQNFFQAPSSGSCPAGQEDPLGPSNTGTYCAAPRVTATLSYASGAYTFTLGNGTAESFGSSGALTSISDPNGATDTVNSLSPSSGSSDCGTSFASSCQKILGPAGSSGGRYLVIAFNSSGQIVKVSDSQGRRWTYAYDGSGDLTSVTDPRGYATTYGYGNDSGSADSAMDHDLITMVTANNASAASGLPGDAVSDFCADPTAANAPGAETVYCYSYNSSLGFGQVVAEADPMKRVTTFSYNTTDAPYFTSTTVTDPDGNVLTDSYYDGALVEQEESPNSSGGTSKWFYLRDPATLLPTEVTDPDGRTTQLSYDAAGNVLTETNAVAETWTYGYAQPKSTAPEFEVQVCATLPEAATPCSGLSPPAIVSASNTTVTPPSAAPPAYTTYAEYDTDGDPVWTSVGQYAPGSSSATNTETSYWLYDVGSTSQSATIDSHSASCSAVAPEHGLPCATVNLDFSCR